MSRQVPVDWTDYNGHMNESRYGQVFSDAADYVMRLVGADAAYVAGGHSYFTAETTTQFLAETHAGDAITCDSYIALAEGKKLRFQHVMKGADGQVLARCNQFLLHVSLRTRKSCDPAPEIAAKLAAYATQHEPLLAEKM